MIGPQPTDDLGAGLTSSGQGTEHCGGSKFISHKSPQGAAFSAALLSSGFQSPNEWGQEERQGWSPVLGFSQDGLQADFVQVSYFLLPNSTARKIETCSREQEGNSSEHPIGTALYS